MFRRARDLLRQVRRYGTNRVPRIPTEIRSTARSTCIFAFTRALKTSCLGYTISGTSIPNCYRLTVRHGYNDRVISAELGDVVYHKLRKAIFKMVDLPTSAAPSSDRASQPESIAESSAVTGSVSTSLRVTAIPETSALDKVQINDTAIDRRIAALDSAFQKQVVYIVGKEELRLLVERNNIFKRILLGIYMWLRQNTRAKTAQMEIPVEKLVEVGFVKEI